MDDFFPDPQAPWALTAFQQVEPFPVQRDWLLARLSLPASEVKHELEAREFTFLRSEEVAHRTANLTAAAVFIEAVPSLALAIRTHVRGISLLGADESYDVTHSEPRWPHWIFVSCPTADGEASALRAAENVVHEAMHLQLTRIEGRMRLVANENATLPSPWKQEPRQLQGILHGLYVFLCIADFLVRLNPVTGEGAKYIRRRRVEIAHETASIRLATLRSGLTQQGVHFLARLTRT